jgi:hypothetical protein
MPCSSSITRTLAIPLPESNSEANQLKNIKVMTFVHKQLMRPSGVVERAVRTRIKSFDIPRRWVDRTRKVNGAAWTKGLRAWDWRAETLAAVPEA